MTLCHFLINTGTAARMNAKSQWQTPSIAMDGVATQHMGWHGRQWSCAQAFYSFFTSRDMGKVPSGLLFQKNTSLRITVTQCCAPSIVKTQWAGGKTYRWQGQVKKAHQTSLSLLFTSPELGRQKQSHPHNMHLKQPVYHCSSVEVLRLLFTGEMMHVGKGDRGWGRGLWQSAAQSPHLS